jgi:hypothetical protein
MGRGRSRLRVVAMVAIASCLMAPAFGAAATRDVSPSFVTAFKVDPSAYGVTITLNTARASIVRVAYGSAAPVLWTAPDGPDTSHVFKIHALAPDTSYVAQVTITPLIGKSKTQAVSFLTDAFPLHPVASTANGAVMMNGEPFFPVMSLGTCDWEAPTVDAAGVNLVIANGNRCGGGSSLADQLHWIGRSAFSAGAFDPTVEKSNGVVGWYLSDEPDGYGISPDQLFSPTYSTSKLRILNLTEHVARQAAPLPSVARGAYAQYMAKADLIGFDSYPLQAHCDRNFLGTVYNYAADVAAQAAPKPTFEWIEVGGMEFCANNPQTAITPQTVHNEIWQAIAAGSHGIGIFPTDFAPAVGSQLAADTAKIAALSPALLSPAIPVTVTQPDNVPGIGFHPSGSQVKASARVYNGATYILVINASYSAAQADFKLPGLGNSVMNTYDGPAGTVQAKDDSFSLSLEPLGVRIFVVPPDDL